MKVKHIVEFRRTDLEFEVNNFLENSNLNILDIKYSIATDSDDCSTYGVLILYKEKE